MTPRGNTVQLPWRPDITRGLAFSDHDLTRLSQKSGLLKKLIIIQYIQLQVV